MKRLDTRRLLPVLVFLLLLPGMAWAAGPGWRPTYDLAMKWVNFIILAAIIIKYAKEPLKNFLMQQKTDVVAEMDTLETEKARVIGEIGAAKAQAAENRLRFTEMKERLIAQGEARKQQIVDQSRRQGELMLEEARKKMETRILQAKDKLKMELADMAFEQAVQQLPRIISDADNQRLLDVYMAGLHLEKDPLS